MACGSGCCGPPAADSTVREPSPPIATEAQCKDKCCDAPEEEECQGSVESEAQTELDNDCCAPQPVEVGCNKGCCSVLDPKRPDGYSIPDPTESGCNKGCCSQPQLTQPDDTTVPSCCEGKPAPCCDQSCLDRLALRDCGSYVPDLATSPASASSGSTFDCHKGSNGKPCADHVRSVRKTYAERLEALGCICRALIALGQESCCSPQRPSSAKSARRRSKETVARSCASVDSCCAASGASRDACSAKRQPNSRRVCCPGNENESKSQSAVEKVFPADACCAEERGCVPLQKEKAAVSGTAHATDLEKVLPYNDKEHVILSISGMTCTGCETKLVRTLGTHPSVRNLKTSLLLSRAEFDLVGAASAAEIMKYLERTTEFKCERVMNRGSNLDIVVPDGDAAAFVDQHWPDGVTSITIVDKETVAVNFDAKIVGARDLITRGWGGGPVSLAPLRPDPTLETGSKHVRHLGYMTLLSICLTVPVLVMAWAPLPERHLEYGSASLALATLVQFFIAGPFYPKAFKALVFSKVIEMDLLVVLSTSAAYIFSVVSFGYQVSNQPLSTGEFFETSTLLVTLIMVGRWTAAFARQKAVESISIRSLQTATALLVTDDGETEIDARLLQYGDVFKVPPDSRIPTDGTVVSGSSEVDESMITGESRPVEKYTKSPVIAGSVNGSGTLYVRLTRLPGDNTIDAIAGMVDQAKLSKPKIQDIADRVASYFVPVVITLTIITFCIWIAIGIKIRGQYGREATIQAITFAITVLIVSCPCAIGLAVPMVIVVAGGVAAKRGVIFKSAGAIEVAYETSHVVFDKTGTITEGKPSVVREWYSSNEQNANQALLLGLLEGIKHPVSVAVVRHLQAQGVRPSQVTNQKTLTGRGVEGTATDCGRALRAGNSGWLGLGSDAVVQSILSEGHTAFCFTVDGSVAAVFGLEDTIRPDAASTVNTLVDCGVSVHIVSGDDDGAVCSVAARLNIAESNVRSRCTPADKQTYVQALLKSVPSPSNGKKSAEPVVIFCGDGTNDAVALAQATIGVHMNGSEGGTDVAKSAADVVLLRPALGGILTMIAVSKKSIHRIAFNFGWSFVYNLFAILLAAGAFVSVSARIPPEFAGLGELVSVLPVIAAAVMLRWSKI